MSSQINANQELFLDILTKEEKEALLTKKMEEIRKKNEALRKRHEEIEAEKKAVSGGTKKVVSPRKETKPLPGDESPKESADGKRVERPRQPKPAGRGKSPHKGAREAPRAQRPGSQSFPDEETQEDHALETPRYKRPLSYEKHNDRGERHHYQRHSSNEEDQGRNQRRGKRAPVNTTQEEEESEEMSEGAYEALKRQHQQLNYQPRNHEFREHDFRENRGRRNRRFQRPYSRNGDAGRNFNQDFSNGFMDRDQAHGESDLEPQAKRIHGGRYPKNENKGYDFSQSPLGPPPDPAYNFLSDRYRHGERQPEKGDPSRRHPKNYGGDDFGNVKNRMRKERERQDRGRGGPPRTKMEMAINMTGRERREYVEWKAEREKVDQARIDRQKSSSGEWRREWDVQKDPTEESSQRVEPGKRPGNLGVVRTTTAGRIGSGRFDRGDRDERPPGAGRKDSKDSQGKPQPNGVVQERSAEKDASNPRPVGRGRGRGRARNRGGGTGNEPGRLRTYSGEDRHVECKQDLLVIKVDNTPGKKSDQVEVEYSDGENEPHRGDQAEANQKKAGPHAEELWWDEEGDDIGLELQGIAAEDDIFEQKELFDDYPHEGYDKNGCFEDAPGQTSQGDEDEWEDCTTSEDFSTDRSQSQTSVSDDLTSPLKVNLNPDAPVFTPTSPISPNPLTTKLSKELKLEEASPKRKKSNKKEKEDGDKTPVGAKTPVEENENPENGKKAPMDSNKDESEHSKSDNDHLNPDQSTPAPEELTSTDVGKESEIEVVLEKPAPADSETTPQDPADKAGTAPEEEGTFDKCQTQQDSPMEKPSEEETAQKEAEDNSQKEAEDNSQKEAEVNSQKEAEVNSQTETSDLDVKQTEAESKEDSVTESPEEEEKREDKEATPIPQVEGETA
ncbi:uncharacterized protein LOC111128977 isoform X5 [Crassostrea virginica]